MSSKHKFWPVAGILLAAIAWGLLWYPYRLLEQSGISGVTASLLTNLIALILGLVFLIRSLNPLRNAPYSLITIALAAGWANLGYVLAVIHGEIMRVLLLFYLAPFWTIILAWFLLHERLSAIGALVVALSLCGAVVMLWQPSHGMPLPQNGAEWIALSAGLAFAVTNVFSRRVQHIHISIKSLCVWLGVSFLSLLVLFFETPPTALFSHMQHSWHLISFNNALLLLLVGGIIFSVTLSVQYGLAHTAANRASVILLFELVIAAISSYLLANEAMTLQEWIGGLLIVLAGLFSSKLAHEASRSAGKRPTT